MTFEFINIVERFLELKAQGEQAVLATVVQVEGSSYRRPGVQKLIASNGEMVGAVSGGCVEKEVQRQAQSVLENGISKVMTYDGRYRLGCEGVLYILLETFNLSAEFVASFRGSMEKREAIKFRSFYALAEEPNPEMFSQCCFDSDKYLSVDESVASKHVASKKVNPTLSVYENTLAARFRLVIVGAEHDSIQLCTMGAQMGWEVIVVAAATNPKTLTDFPGAKSLFNVEVPAFDLNLVDQNSAVILMSHSFSRDLHFLKRMTELRPVYFGLLGPVNRREQLFNEIMDEQPDIDLGFVESLQGPAGLDLGAETPQEIAISILSEILVVRTKANAGSLKNITGHIHERASSPSSNS